MSTNQLLTDSSPVTELLEQRAQLEAWLARLDEVQTEADQRIAARVRSDYQDRLRGVQEALAGHLDALRQERAARQQAYEEAEDERQRAADALEEVRLRHRIGELSDTDWDSQRAGLESGLAEWEQRCQQARTEASRLAEIVAQIEDAPAAEPQADWEPDLDAEPRATPESDGNAGAADDGIEAAVDAAWDHVAVNDDSFAPTIRMDMAEIARIVEGGPEADAEVEVREVEEAIAPVPAEADEGLGSDDDDLAFLEELDRAIEASLEAGAAQRGAQPEGADAEQDADPAAAAQPSGVKCPECGYTNHADAWYCGVCGGDLG